MEREELFANIDTVMNKAFENLKKDENLEEVYKKIKKDFYKDVENLETILKEELNTCYKTIEFKPKRQNYVETKKILTNTDKDNHDIFIIIPIFNATDEQAEECIYSVMDNFLGLDYKIVVISNRILPIFSSKSFNKVPHYVLYKNLFSLPEAYNELVGYAKQYQKDENSIICLMDDDAYIFTSQTEKIKRNINLLKKDRYIAVSGHYYDTSPTKTEFQRMVNISHKYKFVKKYRKPYCHGGACFFIKIKNFPHNGLPLNGLGGISINILEINNIKRESKGWFLYNNPDLKVFHPREKNLFSWITTYLSYEIAWGRSLNSLSENKENIWRKELKKDSEARVKGLYSNLKINSERIYVLGNIYLTRYLKPLLNQNIKYEDLKKYKVSTHINLK